MATHTSVEVQNEALERLGLKSLTEQAPAEYLNKMARAYNSVYPQLRRLGLALWPQNAVEDYAFIPLARHLSGVVASEFGFTGPRLTAIATDAGIGYRELQQQSVTDRQEMPVQVEYM